MNLRKMIAELQLEHEHLNYLDSIKKLKDLSQAYKNLVKTYNIIIKDYENYEDDFYEETLYDLKMISTKMITPAGVEYASNRG